MGVPGEVDITSTINWTDVRRTGEQFGLKVVSFETQEKFLLSAGLLNQLEDELLNLSSDAERLRLTTAAREMVLPGGMASHFQVMVQSKMV